MKKSFVVLAALSCLLAVVLAGCTSSSSAPPISVSLTPNSTQTVDATSGEKVNITATVANDSSNMGVNWTLTGPGSLASKTATGVTYDPPSSISSATTATVTATSAATGSNATASVTIDINPVPQVTTTSLTAATEYVSYTATLAASGGSGALTWASGSSLPTGLSLSSSGVVSGTPKVTGSFSFNVTVTDSLNVSATGSVALAVNPPPPLAVSTKSLPGGTAGTIYSYQLQAAGGLAPYSWTLASGSGSLPTNLSLSSSGLISGMPNESGTFSITVKVTDSEPTPANATSGPLTLNIAPAPALKITSGPLPNGDVNTPYSVTLAASGGVPPYTTWTIASGSLPSKLSLDQSTGVISGTPDTPGTNTFTVSVTDSSASPQTVTSGSLTITISAAGPVGLLSGDYAFEVGGFGQGMAGEFVTDGNGNITGGVYDLMFTDTLSGDTDTAISSGTYTIGNDNRGTLTFKDSNNVSYSFDIAVGSISSNVATDGSMIETTNTDSGTGHFALQDSTAFSTSAMSGGYAFGLPGWNMNSGPVNDVIIGSFTASTAGAVTAGLYDEDNDGTLTSSTAFTGSFSVAANGRGTFTSTSGPVNFAFYVISAKRWMAISINTATGAVYVGEVQQQSGGPYSTSSISGTDVIQLQTTNSTPAPYALVGLITSTGNGSVTLSGDDNSGGTVDAVNESSTIAFTSTSNGRFTITTSTGNAVGYMISANKAFLLGSAGPEFGDIEPQSGSSFTNASLSGSFYVYTLPLVSSPESGPSAGAPIVQSGVATFDGNGGVSETLDENSNTTGVKTVTVTDTYSVASSGRVTTTSGNYLLYVVSPNKFILLSLLPISTTDPYIQFIQK